MKIQNNKNTEINKKLILQPICAIFRLCAGLQPVICVIISVGKRGYLNMEKQSRKELQQQYKNRTVIGGVFCITCDASGRKWIKSATDMEGEKNKYEFFIKTKLCPEPGMSAEWNQYGAESFHFSVIEELKKGETQTDREFSEDLKTMLEMWKEKNNI